MLFDHTLQVIKNLSVAMAGTFLDASRFGVMLDMEMDAIQLGGWECSKILIINILPCDETVFWTERHGH